MAKHAGNNQKIEVKGTEVKVAKNLDQDYISLTDVARHKDPDRTDYIILFKTGCAIATPLSS